LIMIFIMLLVFVIERYISLYSNAKGKSSVQVFFKKLVTMLQNDDYDGALAACDKQRGTTANVLRAGIEKYREVKDDPSIDSEKKIQLTQSAIEEANALEGPLLERNLIALSTIASIATMVGLLGTTIGLLGALAGGTGYAELLTQVGGLTATLLSKSYSREQEYEADRLSVDYLARAGYSVQGAIQLQNIFIEKFESGTNPDWFSGLFRTHPFSRERLQENSSYISSHYSAYRSSDGLDKGAYQRFVTSLDSSREAYAFFDQAQEAEGKGQMALAIETYHKAMQQAPEHGLLLTGLGMAYLRNEDLVPARRYLLKAVTADPDYYKPHLGLGYIYLKNKQSINAVRQLETSVKLLPTVEGTYLLGEAEESRGNLPRARQLYQTVVEADRNGKLGQAAASRLRSLAQ
ncbi:MAG: tetratricopeptide repeat protein, partial [Deltaproteobacteria bacterium]|nr:tetratricopeptide repeat protein [Deltaproteobacteria bacterium]